jgi:SAM-dependent methyltransferase
MSEPRLFDRYASDYRQLVEESVGFAGRKLDFFTRAKVFHLRQLARRLPRPLGECAVLDVGCGVGLTDYYLRPHVGAMSGVDVSPAMVTAATTRNPDIDYQAYNGSKLPFGSSTFDLTFAICVMHHVEPEQWDDFLAEMWRVTKPGGLAAIIEHNPLNPLTRRSVDQCPFDDDAVLVPVRRARQGLRRAGAATTGRRYIMFCPLGGDRTRLAESSLGWFPAGAQYMAWGQRNGQARGT